MPLSALATLLRESLTTNLSKVARRAGSRTRIIKVAQNVPKEIAWQTAAAIAVAKLPTIAVTIIKIEADVRMAFIERLYVLISASRILILK